MGVYINPVDMSKEEFLLKVWQTSASAEGA